MLYEEYTRSGALFIFYMFKYNGVSPLAQHPCTHLPNIIKQNSPHYALHGSQAPYLKVHERPLTLTNPFMSYTTLLLPVCPIYTMFKSVLSNCTPGLHTTFVLASMVFGVDQSGRGVGSRRWKKRGRENEPVDTGSPPPTPLLPSTPRAFGTVLSNNTLVTPGAPTQSIYTTTPSPAVFTPAVGSYRTSTTPSSDDPGTFDIGSSRTRLHDKHAATGLPDEYTKGEHVLCDLDSLTDMCCRVGCNQPGCRGERLKGPPVRMYWMRTPTSIAHRKK
jgi:hypothetical protein